MRPSENIERSVAELYNRIGSPVMSHVKLAIDVEGIKPEEGAATNRVYPKEVVDLFAGEQLVIVGRYKKAGAGKIVVTGKVGDKEQKFDFPANFAEHSDDNSQAFIEKLWAVRRIGEILDQIDLHGKNDELVKELVALSLEHGIMTPYTSFMANETADQSSTLSLDGAASRRLDAMKQNVEGQSGVELRNLKESYRMAAAPAAAPMQLGSDRAGGGGYGGEGYRAGSFTGPAPNGTASSANTAQFDYFSAVGGDKAEAEKSAQNVRQVGNKAFYRRGDRWVDSSVTAEQEKSATKLKRFSPDFFALIDKHGRDVARFFASDDPVTVEIAGTVYEVN